MITDAIPSIAAESDNSSVGSLDGTSCTAVGFGARAGHRQRDVGEVGPGADSESTRLETARRATATSTAVRLVGDFLQRVATAAEQALHEALRERHVDDERKLGAELVDPQHAHEAVARDLLGHRDAVRELVGAEHGQLELGPELGRQAARGRLAEAVVGRLDAPDLVSRLNLDGRRKSTSPHAVTAGSACLPEVIPASYFGRSERSINPFAGFLSPGAGAGGRLRARFAASAPSSAHGTGGPPAISLRHVGVLGRSDARILGRGWTALP